MSEAIGADVGRPITPLHPRSLSPRARKIVMLVGGGVIMALVGAGVLAGLVGLAHCSNTDTNPNNDVGDSCGGGNILQGSPPICVCAPALR